MSQTEFGMIIMTSLVVICSGIALWFSWPRLKSRPGAKSIGFFPVIIDHESAQHWALFSFQGY
ncbi:hypothetical protein [Pseudomonas aeruginosa]|uniref:hypothetical protein n=1 Tax=Pseudomonas aeruginosa TaxID=287 RepID=UPI000ACA91AC|nr:hypothetical protein [Pseudomonas aeruginosa]